MSVQGRDDLACLLAGMGYSKPLRRYQQLAVNHNLSGPPLKGRPIVHLSTNAGDSPKMAPEPIDSV